VLLSSPEERAVWRPVAAKPSDAIHLGAGFPWNKLRGESPGKYESYVDLVAGQWTKVRIQVMGTSARLYVNGAAQPVLIVNDLKQAPAKGAIALWVGPWTVAHFSELKVSQ
jgi:hypothetical protein